MQEKKKEMVYNSREVPESPMSYRCGGAWGREDADG
jgi:hypothetical protein